MILYFLVLGERSLLPKGVQSGITFISFDFILLPCGLKNTSYATGASCPSDTWLGLSGRVPAVMHKVLDPGRC